MGAWDPNVEGDYSAWADQFSHKIANTCPDPSSFATGVSVFGNSAAQSLFRSFHSKASTGSLVSAVDSGEVGGYVASKGALIFLWVLAVIVLTTSVVLSFSLFRCLRNAFKSCKICQDRARDVPENKSIIPISIVSAVGLLGLFACAISAFVFSADLSYGLNATSCDAWRSMRGHFFGAQFDLALPARVENDWTGSQPQREAMVKLRDLVNPKPEDGGICTLCRYVESKFNNTEDPTSLVPSMRAATIVTATAAAEGALLMEALYNIFTKIPRVDVKKPELFKFQTKANIALPYNTVGSGVPFALMQYADQLNETTEHGISLIRENLDKTLGRNSLILAESHSTALTALTAVGDVDFKLASITHDWSEIEPTLKSAMRAMIAIGCILGILAIVTPFFGTWLGVKAAKSRRKGNDLSRNVVKSMGGLFSFLIVFSGLSFVFAALFFTIGYIGSDGCGAVESVAFQEGRWQILPEGLWNDTPSQQTDIPTVLDTCVKQTGNGDIAASLGLRMLLDKMSQAVDVLSAELMEVLEYNLDLEYKGTKTRSLDGLAQSASRMIHFARATLEIDASLNPAGPVEAGHLLEYAHGLDLMSPWPGKDSESLLCLTPSLMNKERMSNISLLVMLASCFAEPIKTISTIEQGIYWLNSIAGSVTASTIDQFCVTFLNEEESGVCPKAIEQTRVYTIDGTVDASSGDLVNNPFDDERILKIMGAFKDPKDIVTLRTFIHVIVDMLSYDAMMRTPIHKLQDVKATVTPKSLSVAKYLPTLFPEGTDLEKLPLYQVVEAVLPEFKGRNCFTAEGNCPTRDLIKSFDKLTVAVGEELRDGFVEASEEIMDFVVNTTIGLFRQQLAEADHGLSEFNCQYVGTSLHEGARSGLCDVMLPSLSALGLVSLFLWFFGSMSSFASWKLYHYYSNLTELDDGGVAGENLEEAQLEHLHLK